MKHDSCVTKVIEDVYFDKATPIEALGGHQEAMDAGNREVLKKVVNHTVAKLMKKIVSDDFQKVEG